MEVMDNTGIALECDAMLDSLQRELQSIKDGLQAATSHYSTEEREMEEEGEAKTHSRASTEVLTLLTPATPAGNQQLRRKGMMKKQSPSFSPKQQKHYSNLFAAKEKEVDQSHKRCLLLMHQHIANQIKALQETGQRLKKRLDKRVEKERAIVLSRKPVMERYNLKNHPQLNVYKSSFYEAVVKGREATPCPPPPLPRKQPLPVLVLRNRHGPLEEEEVGTESSNSWAITRVTETTAIDTSLLAKLSTPSKPPTLIPVREILGEDRSKEERKIKEFVRSMEEQVTNRQHLCLMYRRAKLHEEMTQIMISRGRLEELDTFTPVSSTHRMWEWHNVATPTLTKQTRRKKLNPIDQPVSHHSVDTSPSLLTKPQLHVSQETPPPLSIDHMINTGTQNVKVALGTSTLWSNY